MRTEIRKIFNSLDINKNIELLGITKDTDEEATYDGLGSLLTLHSLRYTAVLKQGMQIIPVEIKEKNTLEEIRYCFQLQLELYAV